MYTLYLQEDKFNVSYQLYFAVFHYDFNLGFGRAATDICATCVSFKHKLKDLNISREDKATTAVRYDSSKKSMGFLW